MKAIFALVVILGTCSVFLHADSNIGPMPVVGKNTLAVLESSSTKNSHSSFFKQLTERGHNITYVTADSPSIKFHKYGEYIYDNVILFAPKIEDALDVDELLDFVNSGRNVLLAADTGVSEGIRDFASECGADFADAATAVIDHHNFDKTDFDGRHTAIIADDILHAPVIVGSKTPAPILFRGIGQELRESHLNHRLVSASSTAYSGRFDGKGAAPKLVGKRNVLVSALQARNNARVVIAGSVYMFSNEAFKASLQRYSVDTKAADKVGRSGNEDFATEVSKWVFQERGVIRWRDLEHSLASGDKPKMYTIKDHLKFSIVIEELVNGQWAPYKANDVQLEFIMIDPYIRTTLKHDDKGRYKTSFQAPDVYGVFTFKVDYHRVGFSGLTAISRIPVRPFRHDQYERFIPSAYPYYAGAFSMLVGLFIFSVVFLYHHEDKKKR